MCNAVSDTTVDHCKGCRRSRATLIPRTLYNSQLTAYCVLPARCPKPQLQPKTLPWRKSQLNSGTMTKCTPFPSSVITDLACTYGLQVAPHMRSRRKRAIFSRDLKRDRSTRQTVNIVHLIGNFNSFVGITAAARKARQTREKFQDASSTLK